MKQIEKRVDGSLLTVLFVLIAFFGGCASGPAFVPVAEVPEGKAVVYVYRKGRVLGAATASHIFINGKHLTKLPNSGYAFRYVEPGETVFSTLRRVSPALIGFSALSSLEQEQNERLRINVEKGGTYYIQWLVGDKMKLMDESTGSKEISGLKLSEMTED